MCSKVIKENKILKAIFTLIGIGLILFGGMLIIGRALGRATPAGGGLMLFTLGFALLTWLFRK